MSRFPRLPQETERAIIEELKKGTRPQKDIAAMFGIHQTTVGNVMARYRRKQQHGDLKVKKKYPPKVASSVATKVLKQDFLRRNRKLWPKANMAHVIRVEELPRWDMLVAKAREARLYSPSTVGRDIANGLRRIIADL